MDDRYGSDVLAGGWRKRFQHELQCVPASAGTVVEVADDGYCGAVVSCRQGLVELEDRHGARRVFALGPGFLIDGRAVILTPPAVPAAAARRTASGSFAAADTRARVARASRIFVEGRHDAELVEKVWGDDLRAEGVVVEYLQGVDLLDATLREDPPSAARRYGVLVDHLVPGSKEQRLTQATLAGPHGAHLRIVGHPFIDVWQCVKPEALGIPHWPQIPRGVEWKVGICRAFGWPARDQADIARAWKHILSKVSSYKDLEPALLGRVEELIDFVTAAHA